MHLPVEASFERDVLRCVDAARRGWNGNVALLGSRESRDVAEAATHLGRRVMHPHFVFSSPLNIRSYIRLTHIASAYIRVSEWNVREAANKNMHETQRRDSGSGPALGAEERKGTNKNV